MRNGVSMSDSPAQQAFMNHDTSKVATYSCLHQSKTRKPTPSTKCGVIESSINSQTYSYQDRDS